MTFLILLFYNLQLGTKKTIPYSYLEQHPSFWHHQNFWIGAHFFVNDNIWKWTDKSDFDFNEWKKDEPSKNESELKCAEMSMEYGYWIAQDCSKMNTLVCEVPSEASTLPPTTPAQTTKAPCSPVILSTSSSRPTSTNPSMGNCSNGWTFFEKTNSCYRYFSDTPRNWIESESHCNTFGAHLTSVHSDEENEFLYSNNYFLNK